MPKLFPKFNATVTKGQLIFKRIDHFKLHIEKYEGKEVIVTVKKVIKGRSTNQNNLYWLWLTCIGNELGYDIEDLHCTFKSMFLTDISKKIPIVRSTTSLSTLEFMEYMEKIARKMTELNITLPSPDEAEL